MSTDEPAWRAEIEDALKRADYDLPIEQIRDLAEQIEPCVRAAEERGRQQALASFICGACGHHVGWIDCPTGGWWAHKVHPGDNHDAVECIPELEES